MKRLFLTVMLSFFVVGVYAQKKVLKSAEKAFRKDSYEEATTLATQASENAETKDNPSVYSLLGKINLQQFIASGNTDADKAEASLKWFKKAEELTSDKDKEKLYEKPIFSPVDATKWIGGGDQIGLLEHHLVETSNKALGDDDYETAYKLLRVAYEVEATVERAFFIAYGAENSEEEDIALEYYKKTIAFDTSTYDNVTYAYNQVIQANILKENYDDALTTLREAQQRYPDDKLYKDWEVDILIQGEKMDEAISGLESIIESGKADKKTYYTLSYLQWNNEQLDDAQATAAKALELDPDYTEAIYVMGSVIYNQAASIMKEANNVLDDDAKYNELKESAKKKFEEALPYFEKAVAADPSDLYSLRPLSTIYDQLDMDDKRDAILDKIDALEGEEGN